MVTETISYCIPHNVPGLGEWYRQQPNPTEKSSFGFYDYLYFTNNHEVYGWLEGWCTHGSERANKSVVIDSLEEFIELYTQHKFEWELDH